MPGTIPSTYMPIALDSMRVGSNVDFDVYLFRLNKMVLFHSGGDQFTREVKNNLLENNVKNIYIHKGDHAKFLEYIENNLSDFLTDNSIPVEQKTQLAHQSISNITKSLFKKPQLETLSRFRTVVDSTMDMILSQDEAIVNMLRLTQYDYTTYRHSVNVGVYSIALAKVLFGNENGHNFHELAFGFFLHDIGKCNIPLSILHKKGPLNNEQWQVMMEHPQRGHNLLEEMNALSDEALIIVMQHHERHNGMGYPHHLRGDEIHIYSKICTIADVFDALTSDRPYKKSMSTFDALKVMKNEMSDNFDPDFFRSFVGIFSDESVQIHQNKNTI